MDRAELASQAFATFDRQDSGCVAYGIVEDDRRVFVKLAMTAAGADSLRRAIAFHQEVHHPAVVAPRRWHDDASGVQVTYPWCAGGVLHHATLDGSDRTGLARFQALPLVEVHAAIDAVLDAHQAVAAAGFVAVDLYDGCFLYDFDAHVMRLIDLDEYRPGPFTLTAERLPGSRRYMSPEELVQGSTIDERSTVFDLGRTLQHLLDGPAGWRGSPDQRAVVDTATTAAPASRLPTVAALIDAWRAAMPVDPAVAESTLSRCTRQTAGMDLGSGRGIVRKAVEAPEDSEEYWAHIGTLCERGDDDTLELMLELATSSELRERVVAIQVLGDLGYDDGHPFLEVSLPVVVAAADDAEPAVVEAAVSALGSLGDERALAAVLAHRAHPAAEVREAVAIALTHVCGDPPAPEALDALIDLTRDESPDVRDWATFVLGIQLDADTPAVRAALSDRLDDGEGDIAGEALAGLAVRGDASITGRLLSWLEDPLCGNLIVEAAGHLADPVFLPALQRLVELRWDEDDPRGHVLADAVEACSCAPLPG